MRSNQLSYPAVVEINFANKPRYARWTLRLFLLSDCENLRSLVGSIYALSDNFSAKAGAKVQQKNEIAKSYLIFHYFLFRHGYLKGCLLLYTRTLYFLGIAG